MSITSQADIDNAAVDKLAAAMKIKLAKKREQGYAGWVKCDPIHLSHLLKEHVSKGDPIDVANFCAFLFSNGNGITDRVETVSKTLSLSRRAHLFIKDGEFFIKLQRQNQRDPKRDDYYIIKKFGLERLKEIRDWIDKQIEESESSNVKTD